MTTDDPTTRPHAETFQVVHLVLLQYPCQAKEKFAKKSITESNQSKKKKKTLLLYKYIYIYLQHPQEMPEEEINDHNQAEEFSSPSTTTEVPGKRWDKKNESLIQFKARTSIITVNQKHRVD